ncbi:MAG: hypothetical protein H7832_10000 [Magnetococcus sp. DMHC-6]
MSILRLLLLVILGLLVYQVIRRVTSQLNSKPTPQPPNNNSGQPLVQCSHCTTWIPQKSTTQHQNKLFCSQKCLTDWQQHHQQDQ